MSGRQAVFLDSRGLIAARGADARSFLQGIITNDIDKLTPERALWSALLTAQGKFLHEFFLTLDPSDSSNADSILIEGEAARLSDLKQRLSMYKLRAKVELADVSTVYRVAALFGAEALGALDLPAEPGRTTAFAGGLAYVDPRLAELGARALLPAGNAEAALKEAGFAEATLDDYDSLRISLGVPDGSRDLEIERSPLLENGFEELHGIDWDKGCFLGQELTARTKYRGLTKKRLLPVEIEGPPPAPGTPIMANGKDAGTMRSVAGKLGLALIRLEHLETPLTAGEARLTPKKPGWATF